jgi:hypothetical protein
MTLVQRSGSAEANWIDIIDIVCTAVTPIAATTTIIAKCQDNYKQSSTEGRGR